MATLSIFQSWASTNGSPSMAQTFLSRFWQAKSASTRVTISSSNQRSSCWRSSTRISAALAPFSYGA